MQDDFSSWNRCYDVISIEVYSIDGVLLLQRRSENRNKSIMI